MPQTDPRMLALAIADVLPRAADLRSEMIAIGIVASGLICEAPLEQRADLVEAFCRLIRTNAATELN